MVRSPVYAPPKVLRLFAVLAGVLLALIGLRFLIVPEKAARSFGLAREIAGFELHRAVGLRDLWLAALAVALAWLQEWRALSLWFAFGATVCLGDAVIAAASSGRVAPVVFHGLSGVICAGLAYLATRLGAGRGKK